MKSIFFLLLIPFLSCLQRPKNTTAPLEMHPKIETTQTDKWIWLRGKWKRTNEEVGKATFEIWEKSEDGFFNGHVFTIQDKDTIAQEKRFIVKDNGEWKLKIKSSLDSDFSIYSLTVEKEKDLLFEKEKSVPNVKAPDKIRYWKEIRLNSIVWFGEDQELSKFILLHPIRIFN